MGTPNETASDSLADADPLAAVPPLVVRIGGGLLGAAGFFVGASGLQAFAFFYLTTIQSLVAGALVLLGAAAIGVAPMTMAGRSWAAIAGSAVAAVAALVAFGWLVYALSATMFSPILMLGTLFMGLAAAVQPFTISPSLRVTKARRALYT